MNFHGSLSGQAQSQEDVQKPQSETQTQPQAEVKSADASQPRGSQSAQRRGSQSQVEIQQSYRDANGAVWESLSKDLLAGKYIGKYGGCNSAWHALAALRAGVDLTDWHTRRSKDEFYLPSLHKHINDPHTRRRWDAITSFDPLGLYGMPPTMSATMACMEIPELMHGPGAELTVDGLLVNQDLSINIQKCAIDYAWHLPSIAKKLKFDEQQMRQHLSDYTENVQVLDTSKTAYLPPLGGCTIYMFGDITKLGKSETETAVRVHDSCCGSDVFGTDICTCRPYLVFAINACVDCAKRGGVGIIVYFQKEGRGLGEVTKYRVYNARKAQEGGDTPENYFMQTESVAGIRDARFQELMPEVLIWLGITRIDWLLSMSSDKYDAIISHGIEVMQRVSLPDIFVPKGASVEITAKICAGYHTDVLDSKELISELRNLEMIRERCGEIFKMAQKDQLRHFTLDMDKMPACVDFVLETTKANYPDLKIPYHSRWRHFNQSDVDDLAASWSCDAVEKARRMVDLATVSVLCDAGAGDAWKYMDSRGHESNRSEGLAFASFDMFAEGLFSSDAAVPWRVNAHGIKALTLKAFLKGFQVNEKTNPLLGAKTRYELILRLGDALFAHPEFFGQEVARPGHIVDYVLKHVVDNKVSIRVLWKALAEGLESIWRKNIAGVKRGDVWVYSPLKQIGQAGSDMIPFHKLSQWLAYSLLEPIEALGVQFTELHLMTGLAEYRNGGLFIDMDVITPREPIIPGREYDAGSELIVEWRALTVCLLDIVGKAACEKLGMTQEQLPLAKILQGGTWAAGRIIAAKKRENKGPPIKVRSDGTVF